jgi:hypothetical protein
MSKRAVWLKLDRLSKVRVKVTGKRIEVRLIAPVDRIRKQANSLRTKDD